MPVLLLSPLCFCSVPAGPTSVILNAAFCPLPLTSVVGLWLDCNLLTGQAKHTVLAFVPIQDVAVNFLGSDFVWSCWPCQT